MPAVPATAHVVPLMSSGGFLGPPAAVSLDGLDPLVES